MEYPFEFELDIVEYFKSNYIEGNKDILEEILVVLRMKGYSQMKTVFLLIKEANFSFINANRMVLNSIAWNNKI
jgi:hypothetical protein